MAEPYCGKCGRMMTLANSRVQPELFLCDDCLPDVMEPKHGVGPPSEPTTRAEVGWFHQGFLAGATAYCAAVGHSCLKSVNTKLREVFDAQGAKTFEMFEKILLKEETMFWLQVMKLDSRAKVLKKVPGSAGYDIWPLEEGVIEPGQKVMIKTGIATAFHEHFVGVIDDRGSVGNADVTHLAGVFDANYRGEWLIILKNLGGLPFVYSPQKAIAQVLFMRVEDEEPEVVTSLPESTRGEGRLGSSGH